MALRKVDARNARVVHLLKELLQVRTALVPHPRFGEQATLVSALENAGREVDVLAKAHFAETIECVVNFPTHAHIEGAGVKLIQLLLSPTDTSRGKERSHRIVNRLLHGRKTLVRTVGTAKRITRIRLQFRFYLGDVVGGAHGIGVQNQYIIPRSTRHTIVARLSRSAIRFRKILHIQAVAELVHHLFARHRRTIFYHNHLKVLTRLLRQTFQQFLRLVGAVINGDNYRILHRLQRYIFFLLLCVS